MRSSPRLDNEWKPTTGEHAKILVPDLPGLIDKIEIGISYRALWIRRFNERQKRINPKEPAPHIVIDPPGWEERPDTRARPALRSPLQRHERRCWERTA